MQFQKKNFKSSVLILLTGIFLILIGGVFVSSASPNQPTLNYPENGSTGISTSPTLNVTVSDPDGDDMNVSFYDASDDSLICENNSIANNSNVLCQWSGLNELTTYDWYVNVTDNESLTTTSQIWNFTTGDFTAPEISIQSPENKTYDNSEVWFNATANEEIDTWIVNYNGTNVTGINFTRELDNGNYDLKVYANDSSGNTALNDSISFSVNTPKININTIYPTKENINVPKNEFFEVTFNVSCSGNDCGDVDITLEPVIDPITGCNPSAGICTKACNDLFVDYTSGWYYDSEYTACIDETGMFSVATDSTCESELGTGDGDCAIVGGSACPSYVRNGDSSVQAGNCSGTEDFIEENYNFESRFFSGSSKPFYTNKSLNPYAINLNQSQSKEITFWVNANGEVNTSKSYEFFGYTNLSSMPSINDKTEKWNVTIIEPITTEETEDSSTGGSSGGGIPTLEVDNKSFKSSKGDEKKIYRYWKVNFESDNTKHVLKLENTNLENKTVNVTISSEPLNFELKENETKKVDIDSDGNYDLEIFVKEVGYNYALINLKEIDEVIETKKDEEPKKDKKTEEPVGEKIEEPVGEKIEEDFNYYLIVGFIVFLLVLEVIYLLAKKFRKNKKNKKKHKKSKKSK